MRVLHLVNSLDVGGVEVGVVNVMCGLDDLGYEQAVCCLERAGALIDRVPESISVSVCGKTDRRERLAPVLRAARSMRRFQPAVVHARNCGAWVIGALAWLLAGCPGHLVFSLHGLDWIGRVGPVRAMIYRQLARITFRMVAVGAATGECFARQVGISPERFTVLHSGVDTQRFQPALARLRSVRSPCRVVVGCVARLGQQKGHEQLLKAFAGAAAQCPTELELRLVGDGPCRAALQTLARQLGVETAVRFMGECTDVPEQLAQFDIFVLASEQEGRPTSIMEAMAAGLPVVATRVGGVADLVIDGQSGLLVAPDDVAALTRAIVALADDAGARQTFGEAGRRLAAESFSLVSMVQNYQRFYLDVSAGAKPDLRTSPCSR
ncbi:Glycosyltransferase [Candidatus Accumulibacter aalborgensis]|uniref:Glycosyltransferase n=1 Tax=Candidatus Accumulibacter aalborgensis TaxID=1860102 RepID=A0A1A8XL85_9PROT|nr:glycosyltransferase [Candidatus Accumulibacter aalborgensis]SBT04713.1 Glycosyltransferase [Candidatus Accumulibacter aalborgensis]